MLFLFNTLLSISFYHLYRASGTDERTLSTTCTAPGIVQKRRDFSLNFGHHQRPTAANPDTASAIHALIFHHICD
jgi:hypothetical protein